MTVTEERRLAVNAWQRRRTRLKAYGQWEPFVDAAPVRAHVEAIRATGMSLKNIAECAGTSDLDFLIYGHPPRPPAKRIRPATAKALLAYWPSLDDYYDGSIIDGTGTARRLRALAAIGWTTLAVNQHIDFVNPKTLEPTRNNKLVTARLARAVRDFYTWASEGNGESHGITPWVAERNRRRAARFGWAPPIAWDDDTIDDPAAHPEWTGHCGTDRGWWLHRANNIPACQACAQAHDQWQAQHKHLDGKQRWAAASKARAAASTRGIAIAANARELFAQGYTTDQAALRLGVGRDRIEQELRRHPNATNDLGAAA